MRIISLLAGGTEIVCALGLGHLLVGRSHECDNPEWVGTLPACTHAAFDVHVSSRAIDAEVKRRLRAGEPLYHIDTDLINQLKPDLLITQSHCEVCAVTPGDVSRAGCVTAGTILPLQAGSVSGICEDIRAIARAMDCEQAGDDLIAAMRRRMAAVSQTVQSRPMPTVVALEWIDPIFSMGNWGPELIEAANGKPLLGAKDQHSRPIAWEQVTQADPDFLIVAPCGFPLSRAIDELSTLKALPGWSGLRAVRENRVVLADGNRYFNRSGTTIVETVELIAEALHGVTLQSSLRGIGWVNMHDVAKSRDCAPGFQAANTR